MYEIEDLEFIRYLIKKYKLKFKKLEDNHIATWLSFYELKRNVVIEIRAECINAYFDYWKKTQYIITI